MERGLSFFVEGDSLMRIRFKTFYLTFSLFICSGSLFARPHWQLPRMSLGSMSINGELDQSFHLGSFSGSPKFFFSIYLDHSLRAEDSVGEYKLLQLESYVVPNGRPASILADDGKSKIIKEVTYVWGDDGKLASRVLDGVLHEYQYDQLGRLTAVEKPEIAQKEKTIK